MGQAACHALAGRLREAVFLLTSTIDALERAGLTDPDAILLLHSALVGPYTQLGLHMNAARAAEVAIALAPRVSDPERVAAMHIRVADTYPAQSKPSLAEASLAKAHDLYSQLDLRTEPAIDPADDLMVVSDIHRQLGLLLATEGDVVTAENHYRAAVALLEQADAALELAVTCRLLGDLVTRLGRHSEATAVYRTGLLATEGASPLLLGTDRPAASLHANQWDQSSRPACSD